MAKKHDYTAYSFLITLLAIGLLIAISQLPRFTIGKVSFKKINILSEILEEQEHPELLGADRYFDTTFLSEAEALKAIDSATRAAAKDTLHEEAKLTEWDLTPAPTEPPLPTAGATPPPPRAIVAPPTPEQIIPVEDPAGAMNYFKDKLQRGVQGRPVRVAVLGDSFIEGDILTADLREQLQTLAGGAGVGFVPFASPLSKFRSTVRHSFEGWSVYNIRDRATLPAAIKNKFFVSGLVCIPHEGATTHLEGVSFRKHLQTANCARILFINERHTRLKVVINDSLSRVFTPEPSKQIQQIIIHAPIRSIRVTLTQTEGFTGYGIALDNNTGISVDNHSIRGNSGMALLQTNSSVNDQIGRLLHYDLIILQYGLNVMSPEVTRYDSYAKTFVRIIRFVQECFPKASLLVMSVGDRSSAQGGSFVTMPAVRGMIQAQHQAAGEANVAFWNTFEGMGGENSMPGFVKKKWAAQDYTHMRYPGGQYIAKRMTAALIENVTTHRTEELQPGYDLFHNDPQAEFKETFLPTGPLPSSDTHTLMRHPDTLRENNKKEAASTAPSAPTTPAASGQTKDTSSEKRPTGETALPSGNAPAKTERSASASTPNSRDTTPKGGSKQPPVPTTEETTPPPPASATTGSGAEPTTNPSTTP